MDTPTLSHIAFLKAYGYDGTFVLPSQNIVRKLSRSQWELRDADHFPTAEEWKEIRDKAHSTNVESLVSDAQSEIETLAGELQEWYDNLPENFQNGDKGDALQSAISTLEGFSIDDPSDVGTQAIETIHHPDYYANESRAKRGNEVASKLNAAAAAINEAVEEMRKQQGGLSEESQAWSDYATSLEEVAGELEGLEWPAAF